MYPDYHTQPRPLEVKCNFSGSGSLVLITYQIIIELRFPILTYPFIHHESIFIEINAFSLCRYDNQNNQYDLQAMIPNGHVEQGVGGFMQLSGG